jgi:toxin-antitoxin system PIN domain toxin
MIAVDTNILVYAHREDQAWFGEAATAIRGLAEMRQPWAIPWPCVYEFLAIVTHPRIFVTPTPLERAVDQIQAWLESPSLVLLGEGPGYWNRLYELLLGSRVGGPVVHDARIAALCLANGVSELWSADRDFGRFPALRVRNPLVSR